MKWSNPSKESLVLIGFACVGLAGMANAQDKVVACLGSSITRGYGLPASMTYPAQLEQFLQVEDRRWKVRNFGADGTTILRRGDRPYSVTSALSANPDIVIFSFGGNATRGANRAYIDEYFVSDYIALVKAFCQLPRQPKVWICTNVAAFSGSFGIRPELLESKVNPLIRRVASEMDLPIIDFFSAFKEAPELYQSDGVHPTVDGARLMAEMVAAGLLPARLYPDFTGNGRVEFNDLVEFVNHMRTSESVFDLVPVPYGDGLVDESDLAAFMEYWGDDRRLVAHWPFDETDGTVAQNAVDWRTPATVNGDPVWQPQGGYAAGAIQLDGIDDYVSTPSILNPADGEFSVFAWVKGGSPEQVILSQTDGAHWLMLDAQGSLKTTLKGSRRDFELSSEGVINDDTWHRVGFTWDGMNRVLYVDDSEVARDTQVSLQGSQGGLSIGAGNKLDSGTFWFGLIDDVRIYDRVVKP